MRLVRHGITGLSLAALAGASLLAAGCTALNPDRYPHFEGVPFRSSSKAVDRKQSRADFRALVFDADRSPEGALQAGEYESIRYCIENYGTSVFIWSNVDVSAEQPKLQLDGDTAVFLGRCAT